MMIRRQTVGAIGLSTGAAMTVAMWLFHAESSPMYEYTIWHSGVGNMLAILNLPALFLGIVVSGNVHQPSEIATYAAVFVQWTVLGCLVAWASSKLIAGVGAEREGEA